MSFVVCVRGVRSLLLRSGIDLAYALFDLVGSEVTKGLDRRTLHGDEETHRDALDAEDISQFGLLVDIDLVDIDLASVLLGYSFGPRRRQGPHQSA